VIRNLTVAIICLIGVQAPSDTVVRLGEARHLTDADWVGIREALGETRTAWVINVTDGSQVGPFKWHANAYLHASVVRGDLRRGPLVDLEGTYEGGQRVWRALDLGGAWAQVALPPDGLRNDFTESERSRPFVVRGEFTDAEIRDIVEAIRTGRSALDSAARMLNDWSQAPIVGVGRVGPTAARAELEHHLTAILERRGNAWVVVAVQLAIA